MSMFMKGDTCELRVLDHDDEFQAMEFSRWVNAGLTTRFLFTGSLPLRDVDYAAKWEAERKAGEILFGIWAITTKHEDGGYGVQFVGTCGLHTPRDIYRSYEFRILLFHPDFIGKGIGTEATWLTVSYGFLRLNANRIWLGCSEDNVGAWKCYEKVGFRKEGVLREDIYCFGRYVNAFRYGMLRPEWEALFKMRRFPAVQPVPTPSNVP